jgi:hypothetical protein
MPIITTTKPDTKRPAPIFIVKLRPEAGCTDPIKAVRALLKTAMRRFGLRCLSAETTDEP